MSDAKTIRVFLVMDPDTFVDVSTTEANVRAKLQGIRKDISWQKFARWAPFDGLPQATTDGRGNYVQVPSWAWKFV
jgi:hypothetical protein